MAFRDVVLALSPYAYYECQETSGTQMVDSSGNARHGTWANGPSFAQAPTGVSGDKSVRLAGASNQTGIAPVSWSPTAFSVMWLINPDSIVNYNQQIHGSGNWGTFMCHTETPSRGLYVGTAIADRFTPADTGAVYTVGTWVLVVYTYDGTQGRLYVDGTLVAGPKTQTAPGAFTSLELSAATGGSTNQPNGYFQHLAWFGTALSAANITSLQAARTLSASLEGTATVEVTTAAALSATAGLSGAAQAEITAAGTLSVPIALAGWQADVSQSAHLEVVASASLTTAPAPAPRPATHVLRRRHSEIMPAPVLGTNGWPVGWAPESTIEAEWGYHQLVVGDVDLSFFRDKPALIQRLEGGEPFGPTVAAVDFPQISPFEHPGDGDLAWWREFAPVEIARIAPGGARTVIWEGDLGSLEDSVGRSGSTTGLHALGVLYRADLYRKFPPFVDDVKDLGWRVADELNAMIHDRSLPLARVTRVTTGIPSRDHGAWDPVLTGWVQNLLATAYTDDGEQWTLGWQPGRRAVIRLKDRETAHWTVSTGGRGVELALASDYTMMTNVGYGEGQDPDGCLWRNSAYPNLHPDSAPLYPLSPGDTFSPGGADTGFQPFAALLDGNGYPMVSGDTYAAADEVQVRRFQADSGVAVDGVVGPQTWVAAFQPGSQEGSLDGAFFRPLAADHRVLPYLYNARGGIIGPNPEYDPTRWRIETSERFGDRITKAEATRSMHAEIERALPGVIVGTITLTSDPEEGSRFDIREGHNVSLLYYRGATRLLHVAHVAQAPETDGGPVTLTVDGAARDMMTLAAILERDRDTKDPAGRRRPTYRNSKQIEDRGAVFDCESGAGIVPKFALYGGLWGVTRIPAGRAGTVVRTELTTTGPATVFSAAFFDRPVTANQIAAWLGGSPLTAQTNGNSRWDLVPEDAGLIIPWGGPDQAAGYSPGQQTNEDGSPGAVTGKLIDGAGWYFDTPHPPWLWVAVYSPVACYVQGRLRMGIDR